jgi:hypothetical protein
MGETATDTKRDREIVAAHVDREQRAALLALARLEDRSLSSVVRRAIAAELDRASGPNAPLRVDDGPDGGGWSRSVLAVRPADQAGRAVRPWPR